MPRKRCAHIHACRHRHISQSVVARIFCTSAKLINRQIDSLYLMRVASAVDLQSLFQSSHCHVWLSNLCAGSFCTRILRSQCHGRAFQPCAGGSFCITLNTDLMRSCSVSRYFNRASLHTCLCDATGKPSHAFIFAILITCT